MAQYGSKASSKGALYSSKGKTDVRSNTRGSYVHGTAVKKLEAEREIKKVEKTLNIKPAKKKKHITGMDVKNMTFTVCMFALMTVILLRYVNLIAELNNMVEYISQQEINLYNMKLANDEKLAQIESSIDLEEIKRIAIGELGMKYPDKDQVVYYDSVKTDYMRKVADE